MNDQSRLRRIWQAIIGDIALTLRCFSFSPLNWLSKKPVKTPIAPHPIRWVYSSGTEEGSNLRFNDAVVFSTNKVRVMPNDKRVDQLEFNAWSNGVLGTVFYFVLGVPAFDWSGSPKNLEMLFDDEPQIIDIKMLEPRSFSVAGEQPMLDLVRTHDKLVVKVPLKGERSGQFELEIRHFSLETFAADSVKLK